MKSSIKSYLFDNLKKCAKAELLLLSINLGIQIPTRTCNSKIIDTILKSIQMISFSCSHDVYMGDSIRAISISNYINNYILSLRSVKKIPCNSLASPQNHTYCLLCGVQTELIFNNICSHCQFSGMCINERPVADLCKPFLVRYSANAKRIYGNPPEKVSMNLTIKPTMFKNMHIQVRSIAIHKLPYLHAWPQIGEIFINNASALKIQYYPKSSREVRCDAPLRIHKQEEFEIVLQFAIDSTAEQYIIIIQQIESIQIEQILDESKHISRIEDLFVNNLKETVMMQLECPITKGAMALCVRGTSCEHWETFDMNSYLNLPRTTSYKWMCPICSQHISSLIIDDIQTGLCTMFNEFQEKYGEGYCYLNSRGQCIMANGRNMIGYKWNKSLFILVPMFKGKEEFVSEGGEFNKLYDEVKQMLHCQVESMMIQKKMKMEVDNEIIDLT